MDNEITFVVDVLYGYVELNSWIELREGKFIGMGSKTIYDREGNITSYIVKPTGVTLHFG